MNDIRIKDETPQNKAKVLQQHQITFSSNMKNGMDISQYEAIQKTEPNSPDEQFVQDQDFSTMVENKYTSPSITSQNAPFLSDTKLK